MAKQRFKVEFNCTRTLEVEIGPDDVHPGEDIGEAAVEIATDNLFRSGLETCVREADGWDVEVVEVREVPRKG